MRVQSAQARFLATTQCLLLMARTCRPATLWRLDDLDRERSILGTDSAATARSAHPLTMTTI